MMHPLHWIACHYNPMGYRRPEENLRRFIAGMGNRPGVLVSVGRTVRDRRPRLPGHITGIHITPHKSVRPFWWKEALLNIGAQVLPPEARHVAVLDADIEFLRPDWAELSAAALEIHPVIHPWKRVLYTDEAGRDAACRASTGYGASVRSLDMWEEYHPGCAWAFRADFLRQIGGWYVSPISHGDTLMALACTGRLTEDSPRLQKLSPAHRADILRWGAGVADAAGGTIGHIPGDIRHWWHGHLHNRRYADLPALIHNYDPATDLRPADHETLLPGWSASAIRDKATMVDGIADYFASRDEDGARD
jgi:hypothetical protein